MKAWEITDTFGIEALTLRERPDPPLRHHQVRVRVKKGAEKRAVTSFGGLRTGSVEARKRL